MGLQKLPLHIPITRQHTQIGFRNSDILVKLVVLLFFRNSDILVKLVVLALSEG